VVWQRLGDHRAAVTCFLNAVTLDREMGNRYDLAMVLLHLGDSYASTGDGVGARWSPSRCQTTPRVSQVPASPGE
jgi:hypothetical protein